MRLQTRLWQKESPNLWAEPVKLPFAPVIRLSTMTIDFTKFVEQTFRGNAECLYSNIKDGVPKIG